MFYSAMMLTAVHLLLRLIGTSFQIYLSGQIGAEGIGLLQLTLCAGSFAMTAGSAGIRTCSMYLTAEELGRKQQNNIPWVLSGCIRYSMSTGCSAAIILALLAPAIGTHWIGSSGIIPAVRLFCIFLPVGCLCGVMTGCYTAEGKIGTLAAVEVLEQFFSMAVTVMCLLHWAGSDPVRACESVILGSGAGSCMTLTVLSLMKWRNRISPGPKIQLSRRIMAAAVPLAIAELVRSGISTAENMMVPKRLALYPGSNSPLASFGMLSGMVFPLLMLPSCILHALSDLLIPELARCSAAGSDKRIRYLVKRSLGAGLIYGLLFGGGLHLAARPLCTRLYSEPEAGILLESYAFLAPMLYCDFLVDAMTKGLGQQRICMKYNILTSAMDIAGLFFLLPHLGMKGYFISFLVSHAVNFTLSLRRLILISGTALPCAAAAKCLLSALAALTISKGARAAIPGVLIYVFLFPVLLTLLGVVRQEEYTWLKELVRPKKHT